ncbi:MAG: MnmC family methyltransferase [Bdellovibrionota bacterium]
MSEGFELVPLENGIVSLRCLESLEVFHPGIGPSEEARILHVEQQQLVERARASKDFVIWDVGLGAAANALTALRALQKGLPENHPYPVVLQSFDKTLSPLKFALENAQALGYLLGFEKEIAELLERGEVRIGNHIVWKLHIGDFSTEIGDLALRAPDAIFYDPYSSKGNAEMWTLDNFSKLFAKLDPNRLCLLTNYTASTYIRVTLMMAGFNVGFGTQVHKKLHTTIASNRLDALLKPFDLEWLNKRVKVSHSAAPLRDIPYTIAPISDEDFFVLSQHGQFRDLG